MSTEKENIADWDKETEEVYKVASHELAEALHDFLGTFVTAKERSWENLDFPLILNLAMCDFCTHVHVVNAGAEEGVYPLSAHGLALYCEDITKFCALLICSINVQSKATLYNKTQRDALLMVAIQQIAKTVMRVIPITQETGEVSVH